MCIFTEDLVVQGTKIGSIDLGDFRKALLYDNRFTAQKNAAMILPIPCNVNNIEIVDSTPHKDVLNALTTKALEIEYRNTRGGNTSQPKKVGQYDTLVVKPEDLIETLLFHKQSINDWSYELVEKYKHWSFAICLMKAGQSVSNQPIEIHYDFYDPNAHYFPMLDVHGDDQIKQKVNRQHMLFIGNNRYISVSNTAIDVKEFGGIFADKNFAYINVGFDQERYMLNGDMWAKLQPIVDENDPTKNDPHFYNFRSLNPFNPNPKYIEDFKNYNYEF